MLKPLLLGLCLCACSTVVWAQPQDFSGYELLVKAAHTIQPAEGDKHDNGEALSIARRALRETIEPPEVGPRGEDIRPYPSFRALALEFEQEAETKSAAGDYFGAANSRLDALATGIGVAKNGGWFAFLVSKSIQSLALNDLEATKLNAQQARAIAERLDKIEPQRSSYAQQLEGEKKTAFAKMDEYLNNPKWKTDLLDNTNSPEAKAALANATAASVKQEVGEIWNQIIANAQQPFGANQPSIPQPSNAATDLFAGIKSSRTSERVTYELARLETTLLSLALQLKAIKAEKGTYPATFKTPIDPFSDGKPLIYKQVGDSYLLYSVGPDKSDDGGQPTNGPIRLKSTGDIVATVY